MSIRRDGCRRRGISVANVPLIGQTLANRLDAESHGAVSHIIRGSIVDRDADIHRISDDVRSAVASGTANGTDVAYVIMGMLGSDMSAVLKAGAAYGAVMLGPFPVVHTNAVVTAVILAA